MVLVVADFRIGSPVDDSEPPSLKSQEGVHSDLRGKYDKAVTMGW